MGDLIGRVREVWSGVQAAVRQAPRRALMAAGGALVIVVVCVSLLIAQMQPGRAAHVTRSLAQVASTATATATLAPTATRAATATRVPAPKPVPTTPPPPPVPTPPPATPTPMPCPTATSVPPTATTAATATASPSGNAAQQSLLAWRAPASCTTCPTYTGNNPSQSALRSALDAAADTYHLPRFLVEAVAWQESKWHEDVTSCDGGLGLMQIQYYYVDYFNSIAEPECGLNATNYDANTATGNALLGAKYLVYLSCYFSYWGGHTNSSYSLANPAPYTIDWYYQQAGLAYPDTTHNPSLCASVFNDPANPEYPDMPSTTAQPWPCPYSATAGDSTLLDVTTSAYNAGAGAIGSCGCIPNPGYVANVEGFIPQFYSGTLPTAS